MLARQVFLALFSAALGLSASADPARKAATEQATSLSVPAASLDDGLGSLPPFKAWSEPWVYAAPAEAVDNGLGDLPPYSQWRDAWVYAMPAEKLDSGLGAIRSGAVSTAARPAR